MSEKKRGWANWNAPIDTASNVSVRGMWRACVGVFTTEEEKRTKSEVGRHDINLPLAPAGVRHPQAIPSPPSVAIIKFNSRTSPGRIVTNVTFAYNERVKKKREIPSVGFRCMEECILLRRGKSETSLEVVRCQSLGLEIRSTNHEVGRSRFDGYRHRQRILISLTRDLKLKGAENSIFVLIFPIYSFSSGIANFRSRSFRYELLNIVTFIGINRTRFWSTID